ncbi:MAG: Smr/MutS family protein [Pseudomonadota bacterium]|jgi:DNA-nicking Smr family endonuclease
MTRKSARGAPPSPEDLALFREAVGEVRPVGHDLAEVRAPPPRPVPRQTRADEVAVKRELLAVPLGELALEVGDPLSWLRAGANPRLLRQLGRGQYAVQAEIDLHGFSAAVAAEVLSAFLAEQRRAGRLCVRVVHGKGLNSKDQAPVLKNLVDRLLRQRGDVLAYRSARAGDGGIGAVLVLLRRERESGG